MPNLDQLLNTLSLITWIFTAIFTIVVFVRSFFDDGLTIALLRLFSLRVMVPILLAVLISLLSAAVVFVQPTDVGVVISLVSPGGIRPQPLRSGLHVIIPVLENEVSYPISWQTYTMSGKPTEGQKTGDDSIRARTSDGQEVRLDSSIIFRISQDRVVTLHIDWQSRYIDDFVRPVVRGVVRTQVSQFTVQEVNSSARRDLEITLERLLRNEFAAKGLIVDQFLVRDITFTDEYAAAIELKQVALEDEERTLHQAQQMRNLAEGRRDQLKTEASGEAEATLLKADAQAKALKLIAESLNGDPKLLTYEYISKLSPNIRVMLVPNNSPLMLPLPDLEQLDATIAPTTTLSATQAVSATAAATSAAATSAATVPVAPQATPKATPSSLPTPESHR